MNGDIDINGGSGNYLHCIKAGDVIDINGGTGHLLEFITTVDDGYLDIYNFSPFIHGLTSTNPSGGGLPNGVLCDNCIVEMGESTIRNKYLGLNVSNSDAVLWADNVFCNNLIDIHASGSSEVDVRQPIVMSYCPPPTVGDVTLYNGCSACGSPVKSTGMYTDEESGPGYDRVGDTPAGTAFNELREIYWQISQEQSKDYENGDASGPHKYANEYNQLISGMKKIVSDYPDSDEARHALKYIAFSQRALGQKNTFNEYANLLLSDKKIAPLKFEVKNMLVADNIEQGNYELALAIADELLKMDDDPEQVLPLLYRKGVVYDKYLGNYDMAAKMYQAVIELDPNSATAFAATRRLEKLKDADKSPMNEKLSKAVPAEFAVYANYPNPFNPETHIKFDLPEADHVTVEIFDVQGRLVNTLANNQYEAGQHSVTWRGNTAAGTQAASGMYFYRLRYQDQVKTQKMLLIR